LATLSYRICSAGETFDRVSPFLLRLGITRLSRQTDLDRIGIPVWCAFAPNARAIVIAQGKGLEDDGARTSAAMEAVERSVATQPSCFLIRDSLDGLTARGERADKLDSLVAAGQKPLAPDEVLQWVRAHHLLDNQPIWLPFDAVHLDRTESDPRFWRSSDGLASGNTREEAVLHAVLERVERDALTLWQILPLHQRYARRIDHETLVDDNLRAMLAKVAAADLQLALFDITADLGIPCVAAVLGPAAGSANAVTRHVEVTLGCGCSLSPALAAGRAVTEAVQSRMTFIAGARDDLLPQMFEKVVAPETLAAFEAPRQVGLSALPFLHAATAAEAVDVITSQLKSKGIGKLYAVDLAPDWLPAAVVKVIAPQLENPDGDRRLRLGARALSQALA
jgi:ribosomal protein S12 methylthiotransferase accessory factor